MKMTLAERLDSHLDKSGGPKACWLWTGGMKKGYGRFTFEKVHRVHANID